MKLQIALDDITREAAKVLLEKIQEDVDIIEIGTPFAYYNDISVIQEFKDLYPKAKILADYKILDGGEFMSALAFRAGADIVTVSVSANNETIAGAIKTARAYEREVLVDTMGVPLERIPSEPQLRRPLVRIISVYIQVLTFLMRRIRWRACGLHGKEHLNLS